MKPTRDQIENATNEELRLWVAEHIMGWEEVQNSKTEQVLVESDRVLSHGSGVFGIPPTHTNALDKRINPYFKQVPNYPCRIDAAWLILHKADMYEVEKITGVSIVYCFIAMFNGGVVRAEGDTASIAICRAALLAVLEDDN